ncbi:hypothetical protein MRX96_017898 [Rhipicephalus microplus]
MTGRHNAMHALGNQAKSKESCQSWSASLLDPSCLDATTNQPSRKRGKCSVVHRPARSSSCPVTGTARCRPIHPSHPPQSGHTAASFRSGSPANPAMAESDLDLVNSFVSRDILIAGSHGNSEGNGDAVMAVIMSLLKTDVGTWWTAGLD